MEIPTGSGGMGMCSPVPRFYVRLLRSAWIREHHPAFPTPPPPKFSPGTDFFAPSIPQPLEPNHLASRLVTGQSHRPIT